MSDRVAVNGGSVSVAWHEPTKGGTYLVLAHGAGGNMHTPSLKRFADGLVARGIGAVRFNFVYSEAKKKTPDRTAVLEACWLAVAEHVAARADRLFLGGRSMGGRIASHIVAAGYPTAGLVFLAYPLHPPGKPERIRDAHLIDIAAPMLFLQGTRDPFARPDLLEQTITRLKDATLYSIEGGDHSHRVPGRTEKEVTEALVAKTADWIERVASGR
jgi:hypothetical protein